MSNQKYDFGTENGIYQSDESRLLDKNLSRQLAASHLPEGFHVGDGDLALASSHRRGEPAMDIGLLSTLFN